VLSATNIVRPVGYLLTAVAFLRSVIFLWAAGIGSSVSAAPFTPGSVPEFMAVARIGAEIWLLNERDHMLYRQSGLSVPIFWTRLAAASQSPKSFASFRRRWITVDGSSSLSVYDSDGRFLYTVAAPIPILDVFESGDRLYVYDALPDTRRDRLWFTTDLRRFTPLRLNILDPALPERSRMLAAQLIFAPTGDGGFVFIHGIGAPVATRVGPDGTAVPFPLSYVRTRARARLTAATEESDLERYSAPARHAIVSEGALYVLRNREDVKLPGGMTMERGRRVDRYDPSGRLLATAVLPATARWILRADPRNVVVLSADGRVVVSPFGPPQPGGLVDEP
jgi:hypothetical protein